MDSGKRNYDRVRIILSEVTMDTSKLKSINIDPKLIIIAL